MRVARYHARGERRAGPAVSTAVAKCTAACPPFAAHLGIPALARPGGGRCSGWAGETIHTPKRVGRFMDRQSKREILILAIGTIMVEVPIAAIAVIAILGR
jgi:hypothetical protein